MLTCSPTAPKQDAPAAMPYCRRPPPILLLPLLCLALAGALGGAYAAEAAKAISADEPAAVVPVFSTYAKKQHRLIIQELKSQLAKNKPARAVTVRHFLTLGLPANAARQVGELKNANVPLAIYLDAESAKLVGPRLKVPSLSLSARSEKPAPANAAAKRPSIAAVNTQPRLSQFIQAAQRLRPRPPGLALLDARFDPKQANVLKTLSALYPEEPAPSTKDALGGKGLVVVCPLNSAACENHAAFRFALQKGLGRVPPRSLLLVLPDTNTLKFDFLIRNFAAERKLLLAYVGGFNHEPALISIAYTPKQLAAVCVQAIRERVETNPASTLQIQPLPPARVVYDREQLARFGYRLAPAASRQKASPPPPEGPSDAAR